MYKKIKVLGIAGLLVSGMLQAQTENSPYSRYGLGDQLPGNNILSRGIGGVGAAYSDIMTVNFLNPASYSRLKKASFEFGVEVDSRTLRVINPPRKFTSASPIISYIQLGLPLSKKRDWGMNIGLRPVTRINYKIEQNERLAGIDSVSTLFEGNGGTYEVYTGTGYSIKNLSVGVNVGYMFGTRNFTSSRIFLPDSVGNFYYPSEHSTTSSFGGLFVNGGVQYTIRLKKNNMLRFGAYGSMKREVSGTKEEKVQTFSETESGIDSIDVISRNKVSGKVVYPANYGFGLMYHAGERWLFGADFSQTKWSDFRYFESRDSVQDAWKFHVGAQLFPATSNSYWGYVKYRAGFSYGQDYVKVESKDLPTWAVSFGLGLPMRQAPYSNQSSIINTSVEFGQRGNNTNLIRENFFRLSVGLTLSDIWFMKRKYD